MPPVADAGGEVSSAPRPVVAADPGSTEADPDPWRWLFDVAGDSRLPIINYSGGTEVSGGTGGRQRADAAEASRFCRSPARHRRRCRRRSGTTRAHREVGELVVRAPWIGMTRGFWKDDQRYEDTYWSRFPDVWVHGDWAEIDEDGLAILGSRTIRSRSPASRSARREWNPSSLNTRPSLKPPRSGVPDELKGGALVCFCVLRSGDAAGPDLAADLKALVASSREAAAARARSSSLPICRKRGTRRSCAA